MITKSVKLHDTFGERSNFWIKPTLKRQKLPQNLRFDFLCLFYFSSTRPCAFEQMYSKTGPRARLVSKVASSIQIYKVSFPSNSLKAICSKLNNKRSYKNSLSPVIFPPMSIWKHPSISSDEDKRPATHWNYQNGELGWNTFSPRISFLLEACGSAV